jgi:hypothetical protein
MAKLLVACSVALWLIVLQAKAFAADSTCYEINQTHRSFGLIRISFDASHIKVDWPGRGLTLFAQAPDWRVSVYNSTTKKQATVTFAQWCKTGLGSYTPWLEMKDLAGHYHKKILIDFEGFKAYKLVCDETRDGISWSTKRKMAPITMRYAFLDGVKIDDHIPKILTAIYYIAWENRILLAIKGQYPGTNVMRWTLDTKSIKAEPGKKVEFKQPAGFQTVPMAQASQGRLDFFN